MIDAFLGVDGPDPGWWAGLCRFEAALAGAGADVGALPRDIADTIEAACNDLEREGWAGLDLTGAGSPAIPVVDALRVRLRAAGHTVAADAVHRDATSQDAVDTALVLMAHGATTALADALADAAASAASLAADHASTAMIGRTLLQQAVPTTFGRVAAGWGAGLDDAREALASLRFPVQLGGPVGALDDPALVAALAGRLGLDVPTHVWHTERGVVAAIAGAFGRAAVAVAKPALDVCLLAQTELGEVAEAAPGGSSSMPHKRNPVAAVRARALAAEAPGLVATVLTAGAQELQRGAGTWHAEWAPMTRLLTATVAAARSLATSLGGLQVDTAALRRHLDEGRP